MRQTGSLVLLQGWGLDANGPAGAVLKGWVESRFGIVPIFHKAPLQRFPSAACVRLSSLLGETAAHPARFAQVVRPAHAPLGSDG